MRAAQSTAMNRLIKASNKVEVDPKAVEKLKVTRADFLHALEHDIKPVTVKLYIFLFWLIFIVVGIWYFSRNFRSLPGSWNNKLGTTSNKCFGRWHVIHSTSKGKRYCRFVC